MTREEAIKELSCIADEMPSMECANWIEAISMAIEALSQEPCKDAISRQEVLDLPRIKTHNVWGIVIKESVDVEDIRQLTSVTLQEPRTVTEFADRFREFAEWVAAEIFDENWEYNKDAFEELACRKLEKLGLVRANGDEWELVEPLKSKPTNCSTCILDNTDACTRGAGRAVDDEACEDYLASPTGAEGGEEDEGDG